MVDVTDQTRREEQETQQAAEERQRRQAEERQEAINRRARALGSWEKLLLPLGSGPKNEYQFRTLRAHLVARYDWDKALKYVDDTNNRFLNKARGLITFNGLTLAALSTLIRLEGARIVDPWWLAAGIAFALVSAIILLITHFLVDFGAGLIDYEDDPAEFVSYYLQIIKRAKWISIAGFFSLLSLGPLAHSAYSWLYAPSEITSLNPSQQKNTSPKPPTSQMGHE